ncbi:MAG: glycosyltransferase family 39 protein [Victivallales bacterium]|nr:glycosyltransferase family 39 protein [Victivallales bacterium]
MGLMGRVNLFFSDSRKLLYLSLGMAAFFVLLHLLFCIDIYDDVASCYAWDAREVGRGEWAKGFNPGLPPLMTYSAGLLCALGMEAFTATIMISGLLYILTAFPIYFLIRDLLGEKYAGWGAFAFVMAPKIIRFSCSGMPNAGRNFFMIMALYLLFSFFKKRTPLKLVFLGASIAGLALSRGEGIVFLPVFALVFVIVYLVLRDGNTLNFKYILRMLLQGLIVIAAFLTIASPRMIQMYRHTGIPVLDSRQAGRINELRASLGLLEKVPDGNAVQSAEEKQSEPVYLNKKQFKRFINTFSRGSYELYLIFAAIGAIVLIYRREWRYEYYVLLAFALINALIFYFVVVSYRYFLVNVLLFMPFTLKGFELVWLLLNHKMIAAYKGTKYIFPALIAGLALGHTWNGVAKLTDTEDFYYEKAVSEWLAEQGARSGISKLKIMSVQPQYPFWADAEHVKFYENREKCIKELDGYGYDYIVLETKHEDKIDAIRQHPGLEEVSQQWSNDVLVFRPKAAFKEQNNEKTNE